VHRYDLEDDTSNGSNLDADTEPAVHYFTEKLAVAIHTSEEVILLMAKDPAVSRIGRDCFVLADLTH